jgi:hypothetical protein
MPLLRRRFFATGNGALVLCASETWSPRPKPRRNPQFRQKRNSDGIAEWQFEQVIVEPGDVGISVFWDITNSTFSGLRENIRRFFIRQIIFDGCRRLALA